MKTISRDEFPNRAFQLAYFIHRERKTAIEIATRALNKLQVAATVQGKRLYYRLTGAAKRARRAAKSQWQNRTCCSVWFTSSRRITNDAKKSRHTTNRQATALLMLI